MHLLQIRFLIPAYMCLSHTFKIFALDPDKEEILMEELASLAGGRGSSSPSTKPANSHSRIWAHAFLILFAFLILGH